MMDEQEEAGMHDKDDMRLHGSAGLSHAERTLVSGPFLPSPRLSCIPPLSCLPLLPTYVLSTTAEKAHECTALSMPCYTLDRDGLHPPRPAFLTLARLAVGRRRKSGKHC